ncbi:ATP-binding protein [Candidatus Saccharibacteria bacterium]|nr:ATP-binding protein [Candidatus Saccharibacteria bacterium]
MEGKKNKRRVLLVFGAPCSGKTTFAEKFAKKFDLAYYDFDQLKEKNRLTRKNILLIIELLARTGKTLVIEGGLGSEKERSEVRNILREAGYTPSLVWIQTDLATIRLRLKQRYKSVSKAKDAYDDLMAGLEAPADFEKPIILSGKHTFETQARHVLAGLADAEKS